MRLCRSIIIGHLEHQDRKKNPDKEEKRLTSRTEDEEGKQWRDDGNAIGSGSGIEMSV